MLALRPVKDAQQADLGDVLGEFDVDPPLIEAVKWPFRRLGRFVHGRTMEGG